MPTLIKICGLTTPTEAQTCVSLGADWLGFNCYPPSKRYLKPNKIQEILAKLPANVQSVGVFVNESAETVNQIVADTGLTLVQLHGDESPREAALLKTKYFRAFRVAPAFQLATIQDYPAPYFLLDSYHPQLYGGTGGSFSWEIALQAKQFGNLILAGGLTPENIGVALEKVRPFGVDVCSGVEASPGVKDLKQVERFIQEVRTTEQRLSAVGVH